MLVSFSVGSLGLLSFCSSFPASPLSPPLGVCVCVCVCVCVYVCMYVCVCVCVCVGGGLLLFGGRRAGDEDEVTRSRGGQGQVQCFKSTAQ